MRGWWRTFTNAMSALFDLRRDSTPLNLERLPCEPRYHCFIAGTCLHCGHQLDHRPTTED